VDLNHILLFLAVISSLVVLARTWRPGAPRHGWRIAALIVLAITCIAWIFLRTAAGYIGGIAWFTLLFLPAIGLGKMTELAAHGDYKLAGRLGTILQILHPSAELRDQVRLLSCAIRSDYFSVWNLTKTARLLSQPPQLRTVFGIVSFEALRQFSC